MFLESQSGLAGLPKLYVLTKACKIGRLTYSESLGHRVMPLFCYNVPTRLSLISCLVMVSLAMIKA